MKSINQIAQENGDTTANEANRIRRREATVKHAWRKYTFEHNEYPTAQQIAEIASEEAEEELGMEYVKTICERNGYELRR